MEKQVDISQSAPKNRQNSLSDDLSGFKGRKKKLPEQRCQQPDDYCFFPKEVFEIFGDRDCRDSAARLYQGADGRIV